MKLVKYSIVLLLLLLFTTTVYSADVFIIPDKTDWYKDGPNITIHRPDYVNPVFFTYDSTRNKPWWKDKVWNIHFNKPTTLGVNILKNVVIVDSRANMRIIIVHDRNGENLKVYAIPLTSIMVLEEVTK